MSRERRFLRLTINPLLTNTDYEQSSPSQAASGCNTRGANRAANNRLARFHSLRCKLAEVRQRWAAAGAGDLCGLD